MTARSLIDPGKGIITTCNCRRNDRGSHPGLGLSSVARHSEPSLTVVLLHLGEANVCTPRPTSSRVTTADGRSPGSRGVTFRRLPRTEIRRGISQKIHA